MNTTRKRTRTKPTQTQPDGSLPAALTQLHNAIHDLTTPQPHRNSRYTNLCQALIHTRGYGHTAPSSVLPTWVDALKLKILIDHRTYVISTHSPQCQTPTTPARLQHLTTLKYRPQDTRQLTDIATEITSWSVAIDDLFSVKPIYLPNPCPQCRQTQTSRKSDDGETVRTPALSVTAEKGCVCQACHATWAPDQLMWLGRVLGYHTQGIIT